MLKHVFLPALAAANPMWAPLDFWPLNPAGNITCHLPIPDIMECNDMPEWKQFRIDMIDYAKRGFPIDQDMLKKAMALANKHDGKDYPPQAFLGHLCRINGESWPPKDRFCLYGFVSAMFVRARHLMYSDDEEARRLAQQDWVYGTLVLGKEGSVDFVESSTWPVNVLDFFININQTEFQPNLKYERDVPIPDRVVPLEKIRWSHKLVPDFPHLSNFPEGSHYGKKDLLIAVLGSHATLSNEPITMIQKFIKDDIKPVFYGLEPRWCHLLQMCDHGDEKLGKLFKASEKDPFAYPWSRLENELREVWNTDAWLNSADLILCTEPVVGCLIIKQFAADAGKVLPILAFMGVALMQGVPPTDVDKFWELFQRMVVDDPNESVVLSSNNLILSEQVFYQTGIRVPVVRAHGLYTGVSYTPIRLNEILMWRAPLYIYDPLSCAFENFFELTQNYPFRFHQMGEGISMKYSDIVLFKAVLLIPWDHALMTFYELYSMGIPLFMPNSNWMYRFLYQRGQLSVGEPLYQSVMPGHNPPFSEYGEFDAPAQQEDSPPADSTALGMSSAKAARGVAEDMLSRVESAKTLHEAKTYANLARDLIKDMQYFLALASNQTFTAEMYTSGGTVLRSLQKSKLQTRKLTYNTSIDWHPYTPFQMSEADSNDWTRKRRGGWWLRRGVRYNAMRYWYQYSDFQNFPGITYFSSIQELLCQLVDMDVSKITTQMRKHNEETTMNAIDFWSRSLLKLVGKPDPEIEPKMKDTPREPPGNF